MSVTSTYTTAILDLQIGQDVFYGTECSLC